LLNLRLFLALKRKVGPVTPFLKNAAAAAVLIFASASGAGAADLSYSYLEVTGDISRTDNTSLGAIENADGRFLGVKASYEVAESWHVKGGYSQEHKSFGNEVLGRDFQRTDIELKTDQIFFEIGGGHHWTISERTDLYVEALAMRTRVDHDIPKMIEPETGAGGPPGGAGGPPPRFEGTRVSVLKDWGYGINAGARHRISESVEMEGRVGVVDIVNERETIVAAGGRYHMEGALALGMFVSYSRSTDRNFDNIRKLGVSLRYQF